MLALWAAAALSQGRTSSRAAKFSTALIFSVGLADFSAPYSSSYIVTVEMHNDSASALKRSLRAGGRVFSTRMHRLVSSI